MVMQTEKLFHILDSWVDHGWCRHLDRAFTRFLQKKQPETPCMVLLAAALASHQLGRGHICLDIKAVLSDPDTVLSLPPEGDEDENTLCRPSEFLSGIFLHSWESDLENSSLVSTGAQKNTPLVFHAGRVYLRRYWQYTQQVASHISGRLSNIRPFSDELNDLPGRLDLLFCPLRNSGESDKSVVHWQSIAAATAVRSTFSVISGGPGTGKTTTVVRLLHLLQELAQEKGKGLRVRLAAPTGKAAARLTASIDQAAREFPEDMPQLQMVKKAATLHRLMGSRPDSRHFVHNAQNPLHVDLLIVDEASMVDLEMMSALLDALPADSRLILIGDKDQLASVEAGSVLGDICRNASQPGYLPSTYEWIKHHTGYDLGDFTGSGSELDQHITVLRRSFRFDENSGIGTLARAVNAENTEAVEAVEAVWNQGFTDIFRLQIKSTDESGFSSLVLDGLRPVNGKQTEARGHFLSSADAPTGYRAYLQYMKAGAETSDVSEDEWLKKVLRAFDGFQILTAVRKGRWGVENLNQKIADILYRNGLIEAREGWYAGRPVMVVRNDYHLGLMNGDIGMLIPVTDEHSKNGKVLRVVFQMSDGSLRKILPSRLNDIETVFAMTVHKSQGSEFDHAALVLPDHISSVLTRELIYTGVTRARQWFTLVYSKMDILLESVKRRTHRVSGLAELLRLADKK